MVAKNYERLYKIARKYGKTHEDTLNCIRCLIQGKQNYFEQIHHIDGNRKNNDVSNLMLLCKSCHRRADKIMRVYRFLIKSMP